MKENEEQSQMQDTSEPQACCEGGSCCSSGTSGTSQRTRIIAFVLIVVAAGAVLANSLMRKSRAEADQPEQAFAGMPVSTTSETASVTNSATETTTLVETDKADIDTPKAAPSLWKTELASLSSLNQAAADVDGVFVLLGSSSDRSSQGISREMQAALAKIKASKTRVSTFYLKDSAPAYANLSQQIKLPCVLAMVKGGGMSAVSDQISEARLIQAFVAASQPSGCGAGGCGPAGCQ